VTGSDARGTGIDLHLSVVRAAGATGRSLETALREAVRSGRLAPGTRLPGSRSLATDLGLARGTVVQVYTQLVAEGWLVGVAGSGTSVATVPGRHVPPAAPPAAPVREQRPPSVDLRPGRPDLSSFPRAAWAASVRRTLTTVAVDALDYGDPEGQAVLRTAIADYVSRARGVHADAGSVVITAGFTHGLALLARALRGLGMRGVATENPGLARHRDLIEAAGLGTVPVAVGADGADPDAVTAAVDAVLLTPAHQQPRGVVLAPRHRAAFVDWARRRDGYLVEDDYDGEFRYDQQPVGALQALAPDRVVYAGTASKTLAPGVRLGWLVLPAALRGAVLDAMTETGAAVSVVDQLALADLIGNGDYDRHVRRVRLRYRRRRAELAQRLATVTPVALDGVAAGLHALLPVESAEQERRLIDTGARSGVRLQGLHTAGYWHDGGRDQAAALVIGYATPPSHAWRRSLDALTDLIAAQQATS
jgi:GntR family transcriptional regulator/MocR family aminotransferase